MTIHCKESEMTKKKILLAAKKEFAANGFSGARMTSIAETAGVNQALLHYRFAGKEKIYKEIIGKPVKGISGIFEVSNRRHMPLSGN